MKIHLSLRQISFSNKSVPWALLAATLATFGLLVNRLGFYQDDWHFVYNAYARGVESMWPLLYTDGRPLAAWPYLLGFRLLGFAPLPWQLLGLTLRWLTGYGIFLTLNRLWPQQTRASFAVALLFVVHPFFTLQPLSVAYAPHWTAFALYVFSLYWMVRSATEPGKSLAFSALALVLTAGHVFTIEYFAGLELVRPLVLWLALRNSGKPAPAGKYFLRWLPYLLIFLAFVVWRRFIFSGPRAEMPGIDQLTANPIRTIFYYAQVFWADTALMLVNAWTKTVEARFFNFSDGTNVWLAAISLAVGLATFWFVQRFQASKQEQPHSWRIQALLLGALWLVAGLAPTYAIGEIIFLRNPLWSSRLGLASIPGAALITWVIVEALVSSSQARAATLAVLVGLAAGWNTRNANDYRWAWTRQERLYRQLTERAPALLPNTAIIAEQEVLSLMGDYPTSYGINAAYATKGHGTSQVPYWFFAVSESFWGQEGALLDGMPLESKWHISSFNGDSRATLYISYNDTLSPCLWVLGPESIHLKELSPFLQEAGAATALGQILPSAQETPFLNLFGKPARPDWCIVYQKSDLARQFEQWEIIRQNWEQAGANGVHPFHGYEYVPFIEAYARLDDWKTAFSLTRNANRVNQGLESVFCSLWTDLEKTTAASLERDEVIFKTRDLLGCQ